MPFIMFPIVKKCVSNVQDWKIRVYACIHICLYICILHIHYIFYICKHIHYVYTFCVHIYTCMCECSAMFGSSPSHRLWPTRLLYLWNFPGKNTGVGCLFLLQGIFLTQKSNSRFPHRLRCRQILYHSTTWEAIYTYMPMIYISIYI